MNGSRDTACVFCGIVAGESDQEIIYQDDDFTAFCDIRPASSNHILVVTNQHIRDIKHLKGRASVVDGMVAVASRVVGEDVTERGDVRVGFHVPPMISVPHVHLHVIWPWNNTRYLVKYKYLPAFFWFWTPERAKNWLEEQGS